MKLTACIHRFFDQYLPRIKGSGPNSIKAYRDAFSIFLPFASDYLSEKINNIMLDQITPGLILAFLDYLETQRGNVAKTRNHRLAVLKAFAKMIRFMYPGKKEVAETILSIPFQPTQKPLIGFLYQDEILKVFEAVDLKKKEGFRDYTILHLLYDSGARAGEIATLNIDYFNPQHKTLAILGKGNRFRLISIQPKTTELIKAYIQKYRPIPNPLYQHRLFINQRGKELTRHGIYYLCKKYLSKALSTKRLKDINPVHTFRHSCAVNMISSGASISDVKNHLGHDNIQSTTYYLHMDLARRRKVQEKLMKYSKSLLDHDPNDKIQIV